MPRGEVTARHNGSGIHPPRGEDMAQQPTWELKTLSSSTALWATSAPNIGTVSCHAVCRDAGGEGRT